MTGTCLAALATHAQLPAVIEDPGPAESAKSARQREQIATLARRHLGAIMRDGDLRDLTVLQRMLDEGVVARNDVAGLQALGLSLGDVMSRNLRLRWVVIDDEYGRSRALRYRETDQLFFPITMISKRAANRETIQIRDLYAIVEDRVERLSARSRPRRRVLERPVRPVPGDGDDG